MKNKLILVVAALALAFTVQTSNAQSAPPSVTPISITQAQFNAMLGASGVTLLSGQTAQQFSLSGAMMATLAPLATPIQMTVMYAPSGSSAGITQRFFISSTAYAAIIAAGATLTVSSPHQVSAGVRNGTYVEVAQ